MPITPCDPCTCIGGNINQGTYRQSVITLLCNLVNGGGGTPTFGRAATPLAAQQIPYTAVTTSYTQVSTAYVGVYYKIQNRTDVDLEFSLNNSTGVLFVEANSEETIGDPTLSEIVGTTGLYLKNVGPDAATTGFVRIQGMA